MRRKSGFSLMEMMIVLLITAVVAAATAPIVSKKMVSSAGGDSPWMWAGTNRAIVYNVGGAAKQTVNIGDIYNGNENPRLYIASTGEIPHIKFADGNSSVNFKVNNEAIGITDGSIDNGSVVIGFGASSDTNDVVIGKGAQTNSQAAVTIGHGAKALSANGGVAVGCGATASGSNGTAIGYDSTASANGSAFGYKATAGTNSLSLGANSNASGTDALAIGYGAQAMKEGCVAIVTGGSGGAKESFSTAYGYKANAAGSFSVAVGDEATAGSRSISIGSDAGFFSTSVDAVSIGEESRVKSYSVAIGSEANAGSEYSTALGYSSGSSGANSVALGANSKGEGRFSTALGYGATAKGANNIAIGYGATTKYGSGSAADAIAIGYGATAGYTNSVAIGKGAKANNPNQIVLGDANATVYIPGRLVVDKGTVLGRTSTEPVYARMHEKSDGNWYSLKVLRYDNGLQDGTDAQGYNHGMLGGYFYDNNYTNSSYPSGDKAKWSDRRLKNVGDAFKGGLAELKKLELFNFTFKKDPNKTPMVGVMAQDLQKVFPNAVFKGEDGFLRIRWDEMFFSMINAIKELDLKITGHDKKLEELQKQNTELQKHIDKLEQRLDKLEKAGKKVK